MKFRFNLLGLFFSLNLTNVTAARWGERRTDRDERRNCLNDWSKRLVFWNTLDLRANARTGSNRGTGLTTQNFITN